MAHLFMLSWKQHTWGKRSPRRIHGDWCPIANPFQTEHDMKSKVSGWNINPILAEPACMRHKIEKGLRAVYPIPIPTR